MSTDVRSVRLTQRGPMDIYSLGFRVARGMEIPETDPNYLAAENAMADSEMCQSIAADLRRNKMASTAVDVADDAAGHAVAALMQAEDEEQRSIALSLCKERAIRLRTAYIVAAKAATVSPDNRASLEELIKFLKARKAK